jgi:hypothetical protein
MRERRARTRRPADGIRPSLLARLIAALPREGPRGDNYASHDDSWLVAARTAEIQRELAARLNDTEGESPGPDDAQGRP